MVDGLWGERHATIFGEHHMENGVISTLNIKFVTHCSLTEI